MFLETPRLILEKPKKDQVEMVFGLFSDALVMRYIGTGKARDLEETKKAVETNQRHWDAFGFGMCNVFTKEKHEFVGRSGLIHLGFQHDHSEIEVGFILHQKFWGKGYATELVTHLLKWAFEHLDVPYIIGVTYKENLASQAVLKKVGMVFDREEVYPKTDFMSLFLKKSKP